MFPMAANIFPMHKKVIFMNLEPPFYFNRTKMVKNRTRWGKKLSGHDWCFPKKCPSDTICYCYGSANFLGWNYTSDKHICVLKPPNNDPEMMEKKLFVQTNLVRWGFWKKYVTRIFALKWHNFEYLGILCFSTMFYTSNSDYKKYHQRWG